jgi:hypothetical protein
VTALKRRPASLAFGHRLVALALVGLVVAAAGFLVGSAAPTAVPDPVETEGGVPVGVDHSPAGAVVASDEYVATEQATVERDPTRLTVLVTEDWTDQLKASSLAAGGEDRLRDPAGMELWASGGQSFTTVAAHRLDLYRGDAAEVTTWAAQIFWGPGQPPSQVWALGQTNLLWRDGRWEVSAMSTLPTPAPAPAALPQAGSLDDTAGDFYSRLNGFSPVSYGRPG